MRDGDSGSKQPKSINPDFIRRLKECAEKLGLTTEFSNPQRVSMSEDEVSRARQGNAERGHSHYNGLPDQAALTEGRWEILSAPTVRLLSLIEREFLIDNKRNQAIIDVASGKARVPYLRWCETENAPVIINGRHRIFALNNLKYVSSDIVCFPEHAEHIKNWLQQPS